MVTEEDKVEESIDPVDEMVSFGTSFEDLEKEFGSDEDLKLIDEAIESAKKIFLLSKREIAEIAFDASLNLRDVVDLYSEAGEKIVCFSALPEKEQEEWTEVAGLAIEMNGDPSDENFARLVHAKTSMGLLKNGIVFDEKFKYAEGHDDILVASPMVAPWECLPHDRRVPLLIFKAVVRQLIRIWDRDNELLKR